jgi:hypothetical protein
VKLYVWHVSLDYELFYAVAIAASRESAVAQIMAAETQWTVSDTLDNDDYYRQRIAPWLAEHDPKVYPLDVSMADWVTYSG